MTIDKDRRSVDVRLGCRDLVKVESVGQEAKNVDERGDDRCQHPGSGETDDEGREPVANEACSTEYESGTSSGYWQEVRANSHRTHEQNGAPVDHSEGADDACRSHQDEVPTRRTSLNTRLREHIGPNECQRLGLIRPGADCV